MRNDLRSRAAKPKPRPTVHLICNAHLDPVWQWRWEEGASEAMATFRVAAEILNEHPSLIFCHNEAVLYRWVERLDPALFREIKRLVKAGRWAVGGGWFLQPDANLPGIESLIRQIEEGREYFGKKFGVVPRVAYNFDSFGHGAGMPQVLRKAGYEMYIHMRPQAGELDLPADLYRWRGADGTEILAYRIAVGLYHTEYHNIDERLRAGVELAVERGRDIAVFWGIGDHGGGPTRLDLERIDAFVAGERRVRIVHSTPERFLDAVRAAGRKAPVVKGDLQRCFTGCYTSLSRLKRRAQESLGLLTQTEALRAATWWMVGQEYPGKKLGAAWRSHLFNDFHDILPGSCVEPAERDALGLYGKAEAEARMLRLEAAAAFAQEHEGRAEIPLTVLNANPALRRVPVEAEFMIEHRPKWTGTWSVRVMDEGGREIVGQEEQPEALLPFNGWRRKVVFMGELPGVGAAFYEIKAVEVGEQDARLAAKTEARAVEEGEVGAVETNEAVGVSGWDLGRLKSERIFRAPGWKAANRTGGVAPWTADDGLAMRPDKEKGGCESFRTRGVECLKGAAPRMLVVDDDGDSWGTDRWSYRRVVGEFKPVGRPYGVERGPVRTIIESVSAYGRSRIVLRTIFHPSWPVVELRLRIEWSETRKRLKLAFPTVFRHSDLYCEVPGGAMVRPADGEEHVHGRWCVAEGKAGGKEAAFGIAHTGLHGVDFKDGEIRLSVLRSTAYCHEQGFKLGAGRAITFADQGVHEVRLALTAGTSDEVRSILSGLADWLCAPPAVYAHLPFGRGVYGRGKDAIEVAGRVTGAGLLSISAPSVRLLACRRSDDGKALIVRLQESAGRKTRARVTIGLSQDATGLNGAANAVSVVDEANGVNAGNEVNEVAGVDATGEAGEPVIIALQFSPFEMKTLRIERSGVWRAI